jgi:hypothetical protein
LQPPKILGYNFAEKSKIFQLLFFKIFIIKKINPRHRAGIKASIYTERESVCGEREGGNYSNFLSSYHLVFVNSEKNKTVGIARHDLVFSIIAHNGAGPAGSGHCLFLNGKSKSCDLAG